MAKSLLGGGVTAVALLSASLIIYTKPSLAETFAPFSPESQKEQKDVSATGTQQISGGVTSTPADSSAGTDPLTPSGAVEDGATVTFAEAKKTEAPVDSTTPVGPAISFTATAYSLRGRTASGRPVSRGVIAADRRVLPMGTRVRLEAGAYSGEYTVADTGGAVRGRKIDLWMPSTREAMRFGRRKVKLTVLTRVRPGRRQTATQPAK